MQSTSPKPGGATTSTGKSQRSGTTNCSPVACPTCPYGYNTTQM